MKRKRREGRVQKEEGKERCKETNRMILLKANSTWQHLDSGFSISRQSITVVKASLVSMRHTPFTVYSLLYSLFIHSIHYLLFTSV